LHSDPSENPKLQAPFVGGKKDIYPPNSSDGMGKPLQGSGSIAEVRKQSCRLTAIAQGSLDTTP
jgi:hypothetical protein